MVAVGFCSYWGLAVAAAAGSTAAAVAVSGYFYTTLGLSSLHCHGGVLGFCKLSLFRYQWSKEGQVCGLRAKVHVCRCGAFSVPRFDLVLDLVFFLYQNPSCSIQTIGKGPASCFCLWASTVPTKKGPLETGVPMGFDQKRIEPW